MERIHLSDCKHHNRDYYGYGDFEFVIWRSEEIPFEEFCDAFAKGICHDPSDRRPYTNRCEVQFMKDMTLHYPSYSHDGRHLKNLGIFTPLKDMKEVVAFEISGNCHDDGCSSLRLFQSFFLSFQSFFVTYNK